MEREKAFGDAVELLQLTTRTEDADRLRLGIIQLLDIENQDKTPARSEAEGESHGEFHAGLIGYVGHMGDERAIPALLGAAGTGGMATRAVARFGKKALDPTLARITGKDADLASDALFVLRDMLEFRLISDAESLLRIKGALRLALGSPAWQVRDGAMAAIEYLEDRQEFVPMLKELADHDPFKIPSQPKGDGTVGDHYFVRQGAARLLLKIENHERPVVDSGLDPSEYQPVNQ